VWVAKNDERMLRDDEKGFDKVVEEAVFYL
jgi:hypothetical protein